MVVAGWLQTLQVLGISPAAGRRLVGIFAPSFHKFREVGESAGPLSSWLALCASMGGTIQIAGQ
jgi:hypothetical protein